MHGVMPTERVAQIERLTKQSASYGAEFVTLRTRDVLDMVRSIGVLWGAFRAVTQRVQEEGE